MLLSATPPAGPRPVQRRRVEEEARRMRTLTPPAVHPTASITWLGPAAANTALAYRISGDPGHLAECARWLTAAARLPHWGKAHLPDHDLDAAWLLHGTALALHWTGEALPEDIRSLVRDKLLLQGSRLYAYAVATEGGWWSSSYWQNHNWICHAGLATAGYVLGREDWTDRAKGNLGTVLDLLPDDGSHAEGVVYWRYGVPWLAIHLDLLQEAEGTDWWERGGFLRNTFRFRLHQSAPGHARIVDHGDCHDRRSGHSAALYHRLAARYGIAEAQWLGDLVTRDLLKDEAERSGVRPGILPEAYLEYLWYDPAVPAAPPTTTPTSAYFPDLGLVTARTGWDADATAVSFKAGPGGGHKAWRHSAEHRRTRGWDTLSAGHHHPDSGAFVLLSRDAHLVVEDGYSNRKRAADHNLLLVDGQGHADEDRYHVYEGIPHERQARQRDVLAEGGWAHATAAVAALYDPALGVTRLDRTLVFTPAGRLVLLDLAETAAGTGHATAGEAGAEAGAPAGAEAPGREWTFLLHTDDPVEDRPDGSRLIRAGNATAVVRHLMLPAGTRTTRHVTEVEANPTSSTPGLRITRTLQTLRTTTPRIPAALLLTVIEPGETSTGRVLDRADGSVAVEFGDGDATERVLLSPVERRIRLGGVTADAAAVLLAGEQAYAVAARSVTLGDRVPLDATPEPFTGRIR
ncbi:hypothetical protein ACFCZ6_19600 [Streptomyces hydrogenans]|uniref:hypothetical protein n=1 Tax=Streptomyces hydrogenans TaxID=1873719 RepID=UPI0035D71498